MKTEIKKSWTKFTDPKQHNPHQFTYLIVGVNSSENQKNAVEYFKKSNQYDPNQDVDLNKEPEKIYMIKKIHASVVTAKHPYVFLQEGLIIKCPPENIIDMQFKDTFTHVFPKHQPPINLSTLDELMRCTPPGYHNQLRLQGKTEYGYVEVIGFFCSQENEKSFTITMSQELNLPLIVHPWKTGKMISPFLHDFGDPKTTNQTEKKPPTQPGSNFGFQPGFLTGSKREEKNLNSKTNIKETTLTQGITLGFIKPQATATTQPTDEWFKKGCLLKGNNFHV